MEGYLDEVFTIMVNDYVDPVSKVLYNVFESYDSQGLLKGA